MPFNSIGETTVVNLKNEKYDIYIGRRGKGKDGYFGNPVVIGRTCCVCGGTHDTAGSTLGCYRRYFIQRLQADEMFYEAIGLLKGKKLGCFCKPSPCHGDIIAEYLNDK